MTPYLRAANVKDGELDLSDVKEMNFDPGERQIFRLQPGDVLVSEGAGSLAAVGTSAVYEGDPPGVCFQNTLLRLRPRADTDPRFVAWWARAMYASGEFARFATGASIYHLGAERVRAMRAWIPTIDEQRRIAAFLDAETERIDELIATKTRMIEVSGERELRALTEVISGRASAVEVVDTGIEWLGAIPADWTVERLKFLARMESGHTPSRSSPDLWANADKPWITLNDVTHLRDHEFIAETVNQISDEGLAASSARMLPPGTVVLSRDATIGRVGIMAVPMATSQHFINWVCSPRLEPRYLWLVMRAPMQHHFQSLTDGATLRTIGMPDINDLRVPVPPVCEQHRIVAEAEETRKTGEELRTALAAQIDLLRERRRSLITAAVTGQMEVA